MGDIDFYELYGVEPEESGTEAGGGTAEDASEPEDNGAAESVAEEGGSEQNENCAAESGTGPEDQGEGAQDEGGAQSGEAGSAGEGGQGAAAGQPDEDTVRRIREAAEQSARARLDEVIRGMNLVNPRTHEPITSYEAWKSYNDQVQADKRERAMKRLGMNEEQYAQFIRNQPEVRELSEQAAAARKREAEARVADQMRQIHALDPSINDIRDLGKMPNYPRFYELVKQHRLSLVDAYKLVNMDALTRRNVEAQAQAMRNAEAAKQHMTATKPRGGGDPAEGVTVPGVTAELYRELFPDLKAADMRRDYAAYLKANKKKGV